jgi:aconitate hydratase
MGTVQASLAGPKRPQDRVSLNKVDEMFNGDLFKVYKKEQPVRAAVEGRPDDIGDGDVVIAAITSCTNTSNPSVLVAAGLVARKARAKGLTAKPWVKTSLAPGSQVVTDYLDKAGLTEDLNALGFNLVGYGCTTCIGNSGPLAPELSAAINENDIVAASVLSGNRNFEGRVSPDVRANFLASPPLVVAYAIKGTVTEDMVETPLGKGRMARTCILKDIWPTNAEIAEVMAANIDDRCSARATAMSMPATRNGAASRSRVGHLYLARRLDLCRQPALFRGHDDDPGTGAWTSSRRAARDPRRFDHHRSHQPGGQHQGGQPGRPVPAGASGQPRRLQLYGARRGNHDVMMRGTFANIRIKNEMVPGVEGGMTQLRRRDHADLRRGDALQGRRHAARHRRGQGIWHRLVARLGRQGHQPARRARGDHRELRAHPPLEPGRHGRAAAAVRRRRHARDAGLDGSETFTIQHVADIRPRQDVEVILTRADGKTETFLTRCRIDTVNELEYFLNGGILQYVLRKLAA